MAESFGRTFKNETGLETLGVSSVDVVEESPCGGRRDEIYVAQQQETMSSPLRISSSLDNKHATQRDRLSSGMFVSSTEDYHEKQRHTTTPSISLQPENPMRLQSNYDVSVRVPTTALHSSLHDEDETRSDGNAIASGGSYVKDAFFDDKLTQF